MSDLAKSVEKSDDERTSYFFGPLGWLAMSADFFEWLSKPEQKHLRGINRAVLDFVMAHVKSPQNHIRVQQKRVAEELGLSAPQVSRAFRAWREAGVFIPLDDPTEGEVLVFSPQAGMRGSGKGQSYLNRRVAREKGMLIPFDEKRRQKALSLAE